MMMERLVSPAKALVLTDSMPSQQAHLKGINKQDEPVELPSSILLLYSILAAKRIE
jgi:hypothetical protein